MAQTGFTPISLYYTTTASAAPTAGNLVAGELALNNNDGKLFYKDSSGVVQTIASKATGTVAGTTTQVIYNNAGAYAGSANMTYDGTKLTLANDASISGLTVGKGGGAVASATAVGSGALAATNTGVYNSAFGNNSANSNTSGAYNSSFGAASLYNNSTGGYNTAIGMWALQGNTTASYNTAVGYQGLYANTTGTQNTAMGFATLKACTTAQNNAAFGDQALQASTTASYNTAVGSLAAYNTTTGANNVAIGYAALNQNTTGSESTAVGYQAGYATTTGTSNAFFGKQAGYANTTGTNNVIVGHNSGIAVTTGNQNNIIGKDCAYNLTTGSYNTYLGYNIACSGGASANEMVICANSSATGKGTNTGFITSGGGANMYQGNNSATWSITSDARLKKNIVDNKTGLDAISKIQVRNFEYRTKDEVTELPESSAIDIKGVQLGAIAQELQAILPECVKTESTGVMSVDTTNLTWYLINAVKELNAKITALENK
jgi:hypothetical protein